MTVSNRTNQWINAKGIRSWVYESKHNQIGLYLFQQCRCDYNPDTHQVVLNYIVDNWLDEYKAQSQIKKWIRNNVTKGKCICSVDNLSVNKRESAAARIQILWLSPLEPSGELMKEIENQLTNLYQIAPFTNESMNRYHKKTYGEPEDNDDTKHYVTNTEEIKNLIENGLM